ncbi:MAG: TIGR04141 family sporadically distributed protein [Acidobacteriota bacterium]|nr:MAG: TIGR04141 family sporadically distributed protein [Acidobacteriota bacterium]
MPTYTIFMLKDEIENFSDAIDTNKEVREIELNENFPLIGTLFLGPQKSQLPSWAHLLNPYLTESLDEIYTANISAVLLLRLNEKVFAFVFGYGRSLLNSNAWVRSFGLRATLNRVSPKKLRSIDSKMYQDLVITTRKQTSRISELTSFELDVSRALVRGVTGDPEGFDRVSRMSGSDGLRIVTEFEIQEIETLLTEIVDAYDDDQYKEHFGWVDNVREVEPVLVDDLDQQLIDMLNGDIGDCDAYLAPVEPIDWESVEGFSFTHSQGVSNPELMLTSYLAFLRKKDIEVSIQALKRHRVSVRYSTGGEDDSWNVYDSIVWETEYKGSNYALFDGRWFEVDSAFARALYDYIATLEKDDIAFPPAAPMSEGAYNDGVETATPDRYAVLDAIPMMPTDSASPIEFCDLLSADSRLIHVKKRVNSAALSHLFAQGSVAAELFLRDYGLRARVRDKLHEIGKSDFADLVPVDAPDSTAYEIVYAVICKPVRSQWPPPLFFFSAVNLRHHAQLLQNMRFRVSLHYIRQQ